MLRKTLIALLTAGLLSAPNLASADRDDRWDRDDRRDRGHRYEHRDRGHRYEHRGRKERWRGGPRRDWRHAAPRRWHRYRHGRWWSHHGPRYYYGGRHHRGGRYYRGADALGGVLLGSALALTITDGARDTCRGPCDHGVGARREITGCYRLERDARGREVRIALPLSRCLLD